MILRRTNGGFIVETVTARRGRRGHDAQMFRTRMPSTKDGRPRGTGAPNPNVATWGSAANSVGKAKEVSAVVRFQFFFHCTNKWVLQHGISVASRRG